jgi:RNA-binding protein 26
LIAEQKVLLKRASEGTQEEKKAILVRLKELAKEVEELSKPAPKKEENGDVEMGQSEESRLGQELAKYGMETKSQREQDELMKLNAQLSALREKVSLLPGSRVYVSSLTDPTTS